MKKLGLLLAIIALGTGSSFAQDPLQLDFSKITQTGKDHAATANQEGLFNTSFILQESEGNKANVQQVNFLINSEIPNFSDIKQIGSRNTANVDQMTTPDIPLLLEIYGPLSATITQTGDGNTANQIQRTLLNTANIVQSGFNNVASQSQDVFMTPDLEGSLNKASINQEGWSNTAEQTQDGWLNNAEIRQPGANNTAQQFQLLYSAGNTAFAEQSGEMNQSTQTQQGFLNSAEVYQKSDRNIAIQNQTNLEASIDAVGVTDDFIIDLALNKAFIYQDGECGKEGNYAEQTQTGSCSILNEAIAVQEGNLNCSEQFQLGGFNYSSVQQKGCGNGADISQSLFVLR